MQAQSYWPAFSSHYHPYSVKEDSSVHCLLALKSRGNQDVPGTTSYEP